MFRDKAMLHPGAVTGFKRTIHAQCVALPFDGA